MIAGTNAEYHRWLADPKTSTSEGDIPVFVDSVECALSECYSGYSTFGTAYRRDDFQEILAAVKSRTFRRER